MLNTKTFLLSIALVSTFTLFSQTYITSTAIVDVENQVLIPNQTVVITNDRISTIKPSNKIKIPANATIIDGSGKYLIPGMTDAHIHFFQNGGLYTRPDVIDLRKDRSHKEELDYAHQNMENVLKRYLQNGITNVIDVGASYSFLKQRLALPKSPDLPTIYMTGPLATTYQSDVYKDLGEEAPFNLVVSVEDGINMVKNQLPLKPDFIKIWYIVGADGLDIESSARKNLPIVKAIIDEAHKNNLKVAVHATQRITAQLAVENGADFLVHSVDDEILKPDFVQLMKKNKTVICPTLIVHGGYGKLFGQRLKPTTHELHTADPFQLGTTLDLKHLPDSIRIKSYKTQSNSEQTLQRLKTSDSIRMANLKILNDAGVIIATGTDAGNPGTMHASSYLAELEAMQSSGMSNWDILTASTLHGAIVLDKQADFGSITQGKLANLVLLEANPIDDLTNLTRIHSVINKGVVFNPGELLIDSPEDLVQRQLNGYNYRNINAFLEPYSEDVEVYSFPNSLQFKGKGAMRKSYSQMFENTPNLHCELINRMVQGNIVIDQERVQYGDRILEALAIYHIENGKIKKVYFVQ